MNPQKDEDLDFDTSAITTTDRWILHALNNMIERVNDLMDNYRVYEAADLLYHFFWHQYCDWYLEFSKNDTGKANTRKVLKASLYTLLQLLHPFMPFITEEIYQIIKIQDNYLLQTEFPSFKSEWVFTDEFRTVELLKKVINETRKTRSENKIDPNKKINIYLKSDSKAEKELILREMVYFDFLTRSQKTQIVEDFSTLPKGFRGVTQNWEILLPFNEDKDRIKELERLKKEMAKIGNQISHIDKKLSSREFLEKAPDRVIANFKKNIQEFIDRRNKLEKTVKDLS